MCKSWCELITGIIILAVTLWPEVLGPDVSGWVVVVAAIALIIHSFGVDKCFSGKMMAKGKKK